MEIEQGYLEGKSIEIENIAAINAASGLVGYDLANRDADFCELVKSARRYLTCIFNRETERIKKEEK